MERIQVHAQSLRKGEIPTDRSKRARGWRQSDIRRAIAAAEQAGLSSFRIEIYSDGTIAIVVGDPAASSPRPDNYADLRS